MKKQSRRNIAQFAKIQTLKPQYMFSQQTMLDMYTKAFMSISSQEIKNDAVTNTVREVVRVTPASDSDSAGIPNIATQTLDLGSQS